MTIAQASYINTNPQGKITSDSAILTVDSSDSTESSYTWTDLVQGEYQFSVVAFTSKRPGKAASLMLPRLPGKLAQKLPYSAKFQWGKTLADRLFYEFRQGKCYNS